MTKSSQYVGVTREKNGKWRPWISVYGRVRHLGSYDNEKFAAQVRDAAVVHFSHLERWKYAFKKGRKPKRNFPNSRISKKAKEAMLLSLDRSQGRPKLPDNKLVRPRSVKKPRITQNDFW